MIGSLLSTWEGSLTVAKPNYAFAKRQRDLAKKQKKEAKRQKKAEAAQATMEAHVEPSPTSRKTVLQ